MDDRHFDDLSRRLGELTSSSLPRRGVMRLFGAGALAAALGLALDEESSEARRRKNRNKKKNKKKCRKDGKKCNKKKCRKKGKACCCDGKCRDGRCGGSSGRCGTSVSSNTRWGSFGSGDGQFRDPWGIATDTNGNVYVTDMGNSRVQVFDQNGSFLRKWGTQGNGPDRFQSPRGIGVNQEGKNNNSLRAFVSDPQQNNVSHRLRKFRTSGTDLASLGQGGLANPRGVAIDANDNVWVVDRGGHIYLFDKGGNYRTNWTPSGDGALSNPEGIAVYKDGRSTFVYVADTGNDRVVKYEYSGNSSSGLNYVTANGSRGGGQHSFNGPTGLAADGCGNIWVADQFNDRIQQLDKNLSFRSRFTAGMYRPSDVAVSANGKFLFVADQFNDQIQKFNLR